MSLQVAGAIVGLGYVLNALVICWVFSFPARGRSEKRQLRHAFAGFAAISVVPWLGVLLFMLGFVVDMAGRFARRRNAADRDGDEEDEDEEEDDVPGEEWKRGGRAQ